MSSTIYILHGWTYDTDKWQMLLNRLITDGYDPVILKIPGLTGRIDRPFEIEDYVSWLNRETAKDGKPIILLGHSNGGRIALWYALKYPQKIKQLILIDSAGIYHDDFFTIVKRKIFRQIAAIGKLLTRSDRLRRYLYQFTRETDYRDASPLMRQTMKNLLESDKILDVSNIRTKTSIIWGQNDQVTPFSDAVAFRSRITGSTLTIVREARHAPFATHPEEVAGIIRKELTA